MHRRGRLYRPPRLVQDLGGEEMNIASRCYYCSIELEHPLEEFYHDLEGAIEEAKKRGSARIPLTCPKCAEDYNNKYGQLRTA